MTSTIQRAELQAKIWKVANDVRGSVDGWDFKQFMLGALFYRFISENFSNYIERGDDSIDYANLPESVIMPENKDDVIKSSANGYPFEQDIKGLFADFDTTSTRLGNTVIQNNRSQYN